MLKYFLLKKRKVGSLCPASGTDQPTLPTKMDPAVAKSDGANMLKLDYLEELLENLVKVRQAVV